MQSGMPEPVEGNGRSLRVDPLPPFFADELPVGGGSLTCQTRDEFQQDIFGLTCVVKGSKQWLLQSKQAAGEFVVPP